MVEHGPDLKVKHGSALKTTKTVTIKTSESVLFPLKPCKFSGIKAWCPAKSGMHTPLCLSVSLTRALTLIVPLIQLQSNG